MINGVDIIGFVLTLGFGFILGGMFAKVIYLMKEEDEMDEKERRDENNERN